MKSLNDFINNQYISFDGLEKEVIEKLSNLKGQMINECDCGCCCCEPYPYDATSSCDVPCECPNTVAPTPALPVDPMTKFKNIFACSPKVYDLLDAHTSFDYKARFTSEYKRSMEEPILLFDNMIPTVGYSSSNKLHDDVLTLCKDFDLMWPVLMFKSNGDIQLFAAKKFGSNGEECSIKSSLISAADILTKLEKRKEVDWAQVLDVSIDNLDDLYDFLFTVTLNKEKYDKELEDMKTKQLKDNHPTNILAY